VDALKNLVCELAAHPYGCRVIQRILEHCTDYQITYVLEELHGKASELTQVVFAYTRYAGGKKN
jgi:hypothetical protein